MCVSCSICAQGCPVSALSMKKEGKSGKYRNVFPELINDNCIGCNKCISVCSAMGACISVVEDGRAREIEVETGIASDGFVEILNPSAVEGKQLIVSGQYFVNDGSEVTVTSAP